MAPGGRVAILLAAVAAAATLVAGDGSRLPLALLGDKTLTAGRTMSEVPLLLVPSSDLALFSNVHISSVSRSQPLVTCSLDKYTLEATPAVRVVLRRPVLVDSAEAALQFPARISVLHEGLRMSVPVGALLAPVSGPGPYLVRVMYAVPTTPLALHYPYYAPLHYPLRLGYGEYSSYTPLVQHPLVHQYGYPAVQDKPHHVAPAAHRPGSGILPSRRPLFPGVVETNHLVAGNRKPGQLVTVLHFPEQLASPDSLYYQPERLGYGEYSSYTPLVQHPLVHQYGYPAVQDKPHHVAPAAHRPGSGIFPSRRPLYPGVVETNHLVAGNRKPGQLVTVLHFPEQLASPDSLYYQPESEDELGNRNPPEAVVPAGIVQSAQPKPNLQLFVNSKEHPILQALRDEAEENKKVFKSESPNSIGVEAL